MNKKLRIDVLCNDGSPLGVHLSDIYGENGRIGVGGAELALLTMCEAWHNAGHLVRLYNNPQLTGQSPFLQFPIDTFIPREERDILIIFRSPNHRIFHATGKKIWWSCDQYTIGDFTQFSHKVDKIVTISPFHAKHFLDNYGITDTTTIDLPVRIQDYTEELPKIRNRMVFCSVPDRGLVQLANAWPRIKEQVPDASISITSDFRLWGVPEPRNEQFVRRFLGMDGVKIMGAVPRREMVREQLQAEVQAYPCIYDELFCYAIAECQVAGAIPVTSTVGAVATTNMAKQISGDPTSLHWLPKFVNGVVETLKSTTDRNRKELMEKARERFSLTRILGEWDKIFYE
jgi:glycosyltransferase involved in cell wall biosynthesis